MPTAAKLIGAIAFAVLAYFVSDLVKPLLPEGTQYGLLSPINAVFGFLMGWRIVGRAAGRGYVAAMGYALTTLAAIVFWCLLLWGSYEMLRRATRLRYDGPVEALQDMAFLMSEYAVLAATSQIVITAIVGAMLCGWLTEFFSRRWS